MAIRKSEPYNSLRKSCDELRGGGPAPFLPEQAAIASVPSDINTVKQVRDKTRLIKQGMMQDLLAGRIRLV